jgi:hypothetical protein
MKIKYIEPKKLKILVAICFGIGLWGIVFGLWLGQFQSSMNYFMITVLGVINLFLGGLFAYLLMTQVHKADPRKDSKYKRKK